MSPQGETLLEVQRITKTFTVPGRAPHKALDQVSFDLRRGEVVSLVGTSGCGKSTLARILGGLVPATSGTLRFQGRDLAGLDRTSARLLRQDIQLIAQSSSDAFSPRMRVADIVTEPLRNFRRIGRDAVRAQASDLLRMVHLAPDLGDRYPHQLSGGQQQRVALARAMGLGPQVLLCDEVTSALDITTQDHILRLLKQFQQERGLTILFISHNTTLVKAFSDRVIVLDRGRVVETSEAASGRRS